VRFGAINIISVHPNDNHDTPEDHAHRGHVHLTPHPG
jgi:hypothetical protein